MVIVVVSDTHLGYANSNSKDFESFLDELLGRNDVDTLVILGDFIDMWRRDVSGLFLENHNILEKITLLQKKVTVYCVAGNHDFHLLELKNHHYPLAFEKNLCLPGDGITYRFMHGWEFDPAQKEGIMELLCYNMSDEGGQIRSELWSKLKTMGDDIWNSLGDLFKLHGGQDGYLDHLMKPPKDRLEAGIGVVERNAFKEVGQNEILIFGHTHKPFVSSTQNMANSGSWVSDEVVFNTYIEIDGKKIRLWQYKDGEEIDITANRIWNF